MPAFNVADLINPESGVSYRNENARKVHAIPLFSFVEIKANPEYPHPLDGLRLFVQAHIRDCDGTPLYVLTHNYRIVGHNLDIRSAKNEYEMLTARFNTGATTGAHPEESLEIIRTAEEVIESLRDYGKVIDGKFVDR